MAELATSVILVAGTVTFANEWYTTKHVNWKVPLATVLLAAAFDGIAHLDSGAATALSFMVLIGASLTRFGGDSAVDTIGHVFSNQQGKVKGKNG